jgi:hypothetical protein
MECTIAPYGPRFALIPTNIYDFEYDNQGCCCEQRHKFIRIDPYSVSSSFYTGR